ncbi:MAG: redoxin domain-containing protein [Planctomycetes bacterium]|nr:redoxin domain-containing protein [Planctomycetota bacterium]
MILTKPGLALALCLLGSFTAQDAKQELQSIQKELDQEFKELRKAAKELTDEQEVGALYEEFQQKVLPEFAERLAVVARANPGTDVGFDGWSHVFGLASQGLSGQLPGEALTALTRDFLPSEKLESLAINLRFEAPMVGEAKALQALRKLAASSPHRKVQAAALYSLGAVLGEKRKPDDPRLAEAKQVLAQLASYDDVKSLNGSSYAKSGAALIFALENLSPGRPCPDFNAVDAEGAGFKLSDYKGKVVLIDFWGFW